MSLSAITRSWRRVLPHLSPFRIQPTSSRSRYWGIRQSELRKVGDNGGSSRTRWLYAGLLGWLGFTSEEPLTEEDELTLAVKRGVLAVQEGNLEKADKMLHIALKMAQDIAHEEGITHIFCLLANVALERGFLGQAERLFKTVLQRLLATGEPQDSNSVVEISLKLAQIYVVTGEVDQAEQGFQFCLSCQRSKLVEGASEDTLGLTGMVLDLWAQFLLSRDRLTEAETAWREAVRVAILLYGEEGEQTMVVTNSLASLLSMRGQQETAASMMETVVEAARRQESEYLPAFLVNLGLVRLRQSLAAVGRKCCEEAEQLAREAGDMETRGQAEDCLGQVEEVLRGTSPLVNRNITS